MLTSGDIVEINLGLPTGSEAGLVRPAVVLTAERILAGEPNVVQVVPLTSTIRQSAAEIVIPPDDHNGLIVPSSAQCQHIRSTAVTRVQARIGNVGPVALRQLRATVAMIIDI